MAAISRKTKSKTNTKKKPTARKSTTGRRTRKRKQKSNLKKNIFAVLSVFVTISLVAFGYFLGNNHPSEKSTTTYSNILKEDKYSTKELLNDIENIDIHEVKVIQKVEKEPLQKKPQKSIEAEKKKNVLTSAKKKPRLAIVIDDVSTRTQMKRIQGTGMKLTPSIFPPSELSMVSHQLAIPLEHYMIHLPMESGNTKLNTHRKTLMVNSSRYMIEQRVKEMRRLFPKAKYINNHTGSIFTANYNAMYTLYRALDKEGFVFIDSRTTSSSKVQKITKEFGHRYIARDIFIDNEHNILYIHAQLNEAVELAKKKGHAVAIGHPHIITMEALKQAKSILKDVELVYIHDIFK